MWATGAKLLLFVVLLDIAFGQELKPCFTGNVTFPYYEGSSAVYDGGDYIYILGGNTNQRFNLADNSFETLGNFPRPYGHGTAVADENGHVYYLGGIDVEYDGSSRGTDYIVSEMVYRFQKGSPAAENVGEFVSINHYGAAAATVGELIYKFGGTICYGCDQIEEYNTTSNIGRIVGHLPQVVAFGAAVYDGQYVYIFGGHNYYGTLLDDIHRFNPATQEIELLEVKLPFSGDRVAAVLVGKLIYIFEHNKYRETNEIAIFNTERGEASLFNEQLRVDYPSAVYVKSQGRVYIFGTLGSAQLPHCLDFPPQAFDCTGKPDGDYPHPSECTKYITCSNELAHERPCPANLNFDSVDHICKYPE